MKYDVTAIGELLIDFTNSGLSNQGNLIFEANPGGAPGNVLAMLTKLGRNTAFVGKVGEDMFGNQLIETLKECGINTSGIVKDDGANTTLAFVRNAPDGDREFSFFRKPGADTLLCAEELDMDLVENCSIFHFGSLSLTHQPVRSATQHAISAAKKSGALISFDPNLRPLLWSNLDEAKEQIAWGCIQCDILKIAEEEISFLTGNDNLEESACLLREKYPQIKILFVTKGAKGSEGFWGSYHVSCNAYTGLDTIDTTGAGDTFCGSCLSQILDLHINEPDESALKNMLQFANAAAALVTTKKGALRSMPEKEDVLKLMSNF